MTNYPTMCVEIWRYDNPNTYRFFDLEPGAMVANKANYTPFRTVDTRGQNYVETHREQVNLQAADVRHKQLYKDGYKPIRFHDLPADLAFWVTHNIAPIEFHRGLDERDMDLMKRVHIWVKGDLPE